jgi:hypothetical protein
MIHVAKWIYGMRNMYILDINEAFTWSCANGKLETAQWLYKLPENTIKITSDFIRLISTDRPYTNKVVEWLKTLNG